MKPGATSYVTTMSSVLEQEQRRLIGYAHLCASGQKILCTYA